MTQAAKTSIRYLDHIRCHNGSMAAILEEKRIDLEQVNPRFPPKTKTEPERWGKGPGGSNRPPRRTALGYMGEDDDLGDNMRKWQRMQVKVLDQAPQGYRIWMLSTGTIAFLKSNEEFKIGSTVDAVFNSWSKDGSPIFIPDPRETKNAPVPSQKFSLNDLAPFVKGQAPQLETEAKSETEPETKVQNSAPSERKYKRATDLLPPPLRISEFAPVDLNLHKLSEHMTWFEETEYTGIIRFTYEFFKCRGAMVLFNGRCVGCMFHSETESQDKATETSLGVMLDCMAFPGGETVSYTLPEEIVLPISAAFLGYPVSPPPNMTAHQYYDYVSDWFYKQESIALIATLSQSAGFLMAYVYKGEIAGCFEVEKQEFTLGAEAADRFLKENSDLEIMVSVLPNEMASKAAMYGYKLKEALAKQQK